MPAASKVSAEKARPKKEKQARRRRAFNGQRFPCGRGRDGECGVAGEPIEGGEETIGGAHGVDHDGLGPLVAGDDKRVAEVGRTDQVAPVAQRGGRGGETLGLGDGHDFIGAAVHEQRGRLIGGDVEKRRERAGAGERGGVGRQRRFAVREGVARHGVAHPLALGEIDDGIVEQHRIGPARETQVVVGVIETRQGAKGGGEVGAGRIARDGDALRIQAEFGGVRAEVAERGAAVANAVRDGGFAGAHEPVGEVKRDEAAAGEVARVRHETIGGAAAPRAAVDPDDRGPALAARGAGGAEGVQHERLAVARGVDDFLRGRRAHEVSHRLRVRRQGERGGRRGIGQQTGEPTHGGQRR